MNDFVDSNLSNSQSVVGWVRGDGSATSTVDSFSVTVAEGQVTPIDTTVKVVRELPDGTSLSIFGVVTNVVAMDESTVMASDAMSVASGSHPSYLLESATIQVSRREPDIDLPASPGLTVEFCDRFDRDVALWADSMSRSCPIGVARDGLPVMVDVEFVDGTRGGHVNISGISGVAAKTSAATWFAYSLFNTPGALRDPANSRLLVFNVKGEDLLFLDKPNKDLSDTDREIYRQVGLEPAPFKQVAFFAPPENGSFTPSSRSRQEGVTSFCWTVAEFVKKRMLEYAMPVESASPDALWPRIVETCIGTLARKTTAAPDGAAIVATSAGPVRCSTLAALGEMIAALVEDESTRDEWAGRAMSDLNVQAFLRRLFPALRDLESVVRCGAVNPERHQVSTAAQVTVVAIDRLGDRAQAAVVATILRDLYDARESCRGDVAPVFIVLDELNRYAPADGNSPIKELLVEIAERGRSLGVILIGAQQTASEVERRVVGNAALKIVGRLDSAEAQRDQYRWLGAARERASRLRPGTLIVSQPCVPMSLTVMFPLPAWATRPAQVAADSSTIGLIGG